MHSAFFSRLRLKLPIGNLTSQFFANVYLNELIVCTDVGIRKIALK